MATDSRAFDEGKEKRFDAVGASDTSDDYTGTDVPGSDLSEEKEATSLNNNSLVLNINASILQIGRDNVLSFRSVDDPTSSETSSEVKSDDEGGPALRELWKPSQDF